MIVTHGNSEERTLLRERIAIEVHRQAWNVNTAQAIFDWVTAKEWFVAKEPGEVGGQAFQKIKAGLEDALKLAKKKRGVKPGTKRGPYKKKRKYTKRSKFWGKKKK